MTITERIEINPKVTMRKPVIRGTRIPVELILRKLSEGATADDLLDAYPRLRVEDITRPSVMLPGTRANCLSWRGLRQADAQALAGSLANEFGKGYSERNLKYTRLPPDVKRSLSISQKASAKLATVR